MKKGKHVLVKTLVLTLVLACAGPAAGNTAEAASKMTLSKKKLTLTVGKKKKLKVKNKKSKKVIRSVEWKSSKKKVATVSKKGAVKAKKAGKAVVTATVYYYIKNSRAKSIKRKKLRCVVTVKKAASNNGSSTNSGSNSSTNSGTQNSSSSTSTTDSKSLPVVRIESGSGAKGVDTTVELTEELVYNRIVALKEKYPKYSEWTKNYCYEWAGKTKATDQRVPDGGAGCIAFNMVLSDAAFGDLPARYYDIAKKEIQAKDIRVGDIIYYVPEQNRATGQEHSITILTIGTEKDENGVERTVYTVAEGNVVISLNGTTSNGSVYWDRKVYADEIFGTEGSGIFALSRYPEK